MNNMLTNCYHTDWEHTHYGSLEETDDSYLLHAQVPGVSKEDLSIQFKDDVLSVKGENKRYRYFKEYFIPDDADTSSFSARLNNGILSVEVSKLAEKKPLTIQIN
jgi:HSP20 family protein